MASTKRRVLLAGSKLGPESAPWSVRSPLRIGPAGAFARAVGVSPVRWRRNSASSNSARSCDNVLLIAGCVTPARRGADDAQLVEQRIERDEFTEASSMSVPREIDTAELDARLNSAHPPIVAEILGPTSFNLGHLPSAINLPLEGFVEDAARAIPQRDADVVYCASSTCQNSDIAARELLSLGYRNVRVYRGGKAAWKDAGLALSMT